MSDRASTETIALGDIEVTDRNPRTHFDEGALESLTRSIEERGLLQPILVRPIRENGDGPRYELVSGERRYRAHRRLERETIRAEVRELTAHEAAELRLVENIEREDLHPLEEAAAYEELLDGGWEPEDVADQVGRTPRYVYGRRKLLDLVEEAREAFLEDDRILLGHAQLIARLDEEEQKQALQAVTHQVFGFNSGSERDGPLSVAGLRAWIEEHLHLNLQHAPFSMDDEDLYPEMGACRDCPFRSGSHPELFDDVDEATVCTKPSCYQEKVERTIRRKADQLREDGVDPVVGAASGFGYRREDGDEEEFGVDEIVAVGTWSSPATRVQDDPCGHEFRAVSIAGSERGEFITICMEGGCEEHGRSRSSTRSEPDPVNVWQRGFRMERRRWRKTLNRLTGEAAAMIAIDLTEPEALRTAVLRLYCNMWHDRMVAVAELVGWPQPPSGYTGDEEEAVDYREEIRERLDAAGPDELHAVIWAMAFQRLLDGNADLVDHDEWKSSSAMLLLSATGTSPGELRATTTEKRVQENDAPLLPEYVDTVVVVETDDEGAEPIGHLLPAGADECRCGGESADAADRTLGPGDGDLDGVSIYRPCLEAFFEAEVQDEEEG